MIRLISTDFDGTIHDPSVPLPIPGEFIGRVRAAKRDGAKWIVNTGREMEDVLGKLRALGVEPLPDYIVEVERHIHESDRGLWRAHEEWNDACQADHDDLFAGAGGPMGRIREWVTGRFAAHVYEDPWSPLCIIAERGADADRIHARIEEECRGIAELTVVRNEVYFRFGHVKYSKGTALGEIARREGVAREEVFAVGDHYNDLPMLDGTHAGVVAAPSNAINEVKTAVRAAGGYVASRPCGFGVVEALDFFAGSKLV